MLETDSRTIACHVRDLSESGMSFFILDSLATQRGLLTKGARCRVVLALPTGVIYLSGQLVWCQFPDAQRPDLGAVMAVQITEIKRDAKEHYLAYLGSLE
ncbi:MAG: PilZ domain-containing protein [Acidobacteria bacterium]|nr:PilZ domain-containing protein [Acidobacteriota bacterium]